MMKIYRIVMLGLFMFACACSKNKGTTEIMPEEPKPQAIAAVISDPNDAFTFEFKSTSLNAKRVRWTFGDDSVATVANAKHTYLSSGKFNVLLRVENDEGYIAQKEITVVIKPESIANIVAVPTTPGDIRLEISSETTFKNFKWTFADNRSSTEVTPTRSFAGGKIEIVTLTATTEKGSVVTVKKMVSEFGGISDVTTGAGLAVSKENASGPFGGEGSLKIIDGNNNTKFFTGNFSSDFWIRQALTAPQVVRIYSITSGNDEKIRDPKTWTIEGSVDGESWEILDRRDEEFTGRNQVKVFSFNNSKSFSYYRWAITSNWGNITAFQVSEWRLYRID